MSHPKIFTHQLLPPPSSLSSLSYLVRLDWVIRRGRQKKSSVSVTSVVRSALRVECRADLNPDLGRWWLGGLLEHRPQ